MTTVLEKERTATGLRTLIAEQQRYVNHFFSCLNPEEAEGFFASLVACEGELFFTGVGKSGFIAQKIAATMASTGTTAHYLSTNDALHGDLGNVGSNDIVIMLSKSGESDELLQLVPFVRNKGAAVLAMVCQKGSRIAQAVDATIYLPLERELCPFDLAPTTSASIQLLFGDILAVALMRSKNFSKEEYAKNHPAGRIGKRISVHVSDLMLRGDAVPTCKPDQLLGDLLVELSNKRCGCLLVTDERENLLGIFTDGDLRRALQRDLGDVLQKPIHELMTREPRRTTPDALAWDAMQKMEENQKSPIMVLPVVEEGRVVGLVKMHDLIQAGL